MNAAQECLERRGQLCWVRGGGGRAQRIWARR